MIKCWKLLHIITSMHVFLVLNLLEDVVNETACSWWMKAQIYALQSIWFLYIIHWSYQTFGKRRPTFSNWQANSSNSDGFAHRMMWCKLAIRASITTSVHFRNVCSDNPNSCDSGRKLLTNGKENYDHMTHILLCLIPKSTQILATFMCLQTHPLSSKVVNGSRSAK